MQLPRCKKNSVNRRVAWKHSIVNLEALKCFIADKGKDGVVIAFSGGVDSSTLAAVSHEVLGERAVAVIAQSPTYTSEELQDAKQIAKDIGIKLYIVETNELDNPDFNRNPENRCYYCKKELLQTLLDFAHKLGFKAVFEGTNFQRLKRPPTRFQSCPRSQRRFQPMDD